MIVRESIDDDRDIYNRDVYRGEPAETPKKQEKPDSSLFLKPKSKAELERIKQGLNPEDLVFAALRNNNLELLKFAIEEKKANLMSGKPYPFYELHAALRFANYEIVKYLLSKYPKFKDDEFFDNHMLADAVYTDDIEIVKLFLKDKRINPWGDKRSTFFINALDKLNFDIIDLLIKDGRINPIGIEEFRGHMKMDPRGIRYNAFSPLGSIDWRLRQHEKSLTIDKWKKYRLTNDQIKKLQETKEKLFKILEKNEKKNLRFARGREVYQSQNGSFRSRLDKDAWGSGRVYESIFKPKDEQEIKQSLSHLSPNQLLTLGKHKNLEEPILYALEQDYFDPNKISDLVNWAIEYNKPRVLKKILEEYKINSTPLQKFLVNSKYEVTKILLDYGVTPTNECLNNAILNDDFKKVQLLIQNYEIDPAADNHVALSFALHNYEVIHHENGLKIMNLLINDPRIRASLDKNTLNTLDKNFNVPVKENLLYINKIKQ